MNKVWKNKHMDDEENKGTNAGTDHDETVLKENWFKAKGVEVCIEDGRLVLDEDDDANVDHQQSCGHEQLGPSVTKEISDDEAVLHKMARGVTCCAPSPRFPRWTLMRTLPRSPAQFPRRSDPQRSLERQISSQQRRGCRPNWIEHSR